MNNFTYTIYSVMLRSSTKQKQTTTKKGIKKMNKAQIKALSKIQPIMTVNGFYKLNSIEETSQGFYKITLQDKSENKLVTHIEITTRGKATAYTLPHWMDHYNKTDIKKICGLHINDRTTYENYWYTTL